MAVPNITRVMKSLKLAGMDVPEDIFTVEQAKEAILRVLRGIRMLKDLTIGQYFPGRSFIHLLDPRIKIVISFLFIVLIFL